MWPSIHADIGGDWPGARPGGREHAGGVGHCVRAAFTATPEGGSSLEREINTIGRFLNAHGNDATFYSTRRVLYAPYLTFISAKPHITMPAEASEPNMCGIFMC